MTWEIFCSKNKFTPRFSLYSPFYWSVIFLIRGNSKVRVLKNCRNKLIFGEDLCLACGIFQTLVPGYQGGRYLAKYRLHLKSTQFACLWLGRSETVSSPSDRDWIIRSNLTPAAFCCQRSGSSWDSAYTDPVPASLPSEPLLTPPYSSGTWSVDNMIIIIQVI